MSDATHGLPDIHSSSARTHAPRSQRTLSTEGLTWLAAGGLFHTIGAAIYGAERPDPYPNVFGFHDVFHLFVLAGSGAHFMLMVRGVLPLT